MAQQGDNYANDYSANYASGNEMIDLNTRRRAALAEVMIKLIAWFASLNSSLNSYMLIFFSFHPLLSD